MSRCLIVAGTDTDVGKTIVSAALVAVLDGCYWKPIQAGLAGETDAEIVRRLSGAPEDRILQEAYRLKTPASPHLAAERDGIAIDAQKLVLPKTERALIVEAAGGLMVPLTRDFLQIDLLARWAMPVILCASTRLGTINHSLLSVEALKRRAIPLLGIVFVGEENGDSERTIAEIGGVRRLGRLPMLDPLDGARLRAAFDDNFSRADFFAEAAS